MNTNINLYIKFCTLFETLNDKEYNHWVTDQVSGILDTFWESMSVEEHIEVNKYFKNGPG